MAKISLLPALNDPNGTELVPVVKDGKTMRASVAGLVAGAVAGTVDNLKVDAVAYIGRPGDVALVDGTPTGIGAVYWHDTVDDAGSVTAVDVFDRAAGTINLAVYRGPRNALVRVALTSFQTTGTRTSRRIALAESIAVRAGDFLAVQPTDGALTVAEVQSGDVGYTYSAPYLPETIALDAPTTNGQVQVRFVIAYRKQVVTADTFLASTAVKITGPRAVALSSDVNPRGYVAWTTAGKPTGHLVKWGNYTATLDGKAQRMEFPNFSLAQPYAFIGNSLTDSTDVVNRWSQVLAARYGQVMISVARYSSDWRMVYRVGAKEIVLTLAGALPAAGTVAVSKINGAAIDGNNPAAFLTTGDPGVVSGMAMSGYLTRNGVTRRATVSASNGASFAYVVTQAPGQTAITFDGPVTFVPDFALSVPGRICVIWLGNNYFFSGVANLYGDNTNPQMWVDLKLIVAFLQARGCRVLLLPVIPSSNTVEGDNWLARGAGTPYTAMEAANARTEAMFPGLMARHADGRTLLKFLQDRNDGSPEALDDVAKGFTPRNLRRRSDGSYDLLHMYGDGTGDLAVADFVDSALQAQALPNLVTQTTDFIITAIGAEGQLPDTAITRVSRDTVGDIADRLAIASAAVSKVTASVGSMSLVPYSNPKYSHAFVDEGRHILALIERAGARWNVALSQDMFAAAGDRTSASLIQSPAGTEIQIAAANASRFGSLNVKALTHSKYSHALIDESKNILAYIERASAKWLIALSDDVAISPQAILGDARFASQDARRSGFLFPWYTTDRTLVGGILNSGKLLASLDERSIIPPSTVAAAIASLLASSNMGMPSSRFYFSGDSLTAGAGGAGTTMPIVMVTALGGKLYVNTGVGGTRSDSIGVRQGAIAMNLTLAADLPADTSEVDVTAYSVEFTNNQGSQTIAGVIGDVPVILRRYGVSGNEAVTAKYTVRRVTAAASTTAIAPGTRFFSTIATGNELDFHYIQAGQNDSKTTRADKIAIRDNILQMIDRIGHDRFGIIALKPTGVAEVKGSSGYTIKAEINDLIAQAVGPHFIRSYEYMASAGALADAGITPTQSDLDTIAGGAIPPSLLVDSIHGNAAYYTLEGNFMARWHRGQGWN